MLRGREGHERRHGRPGQLWAALAVAVLLGACGGHGQRTAPSRSAFGFNDNSVRDGQASPARSAVLTRRAGGRVTRLVFDWRRAEPRPDAYRLDTYDAVYRNSLARGVQPLWIVMFAPPWARDAGVRCRGDCHYPPARGALGRWRELVALVARRYPRSAGIEVWNEPNLSAFWSPRPQPGRYAQLLRSAHAAVRAVAPRMPVANGGLAPVAATGARRVALGDFLGALYAGGARETTDALSVHLYPDKPGALPVGEVLRRVRSLRDANRDQGKPLWVTETGATTTGPDRVSPARQAKLLAGLRRRLVRQRDVRMVLVHTLLDPPLERSNPEAGYGVLDSRGRHKPAFYALARMLD
jgi:hypothetical protein